MLFLAYADLFQNQKILSGILNTIRVSNCLDPDHDRHSVSPDIGPNCFKRLSADTGFAQA